MGALRRRIRDGLQERILHPPDGPMTRVMGGAAFAAVGMLLRFALSAVFRDSTPFVAFFPAVLAAAVFLGPLGAWACTATCVAASVWIVLTRGDWHPGQGAAPLLFFLASAGAIVGLTQLLRDTLQSAVRAHQHQAVLLAELQHRVKNNLALVQGLSQQTWRSTPEPQAFHAKFSERLRALASAHNLLSEAAWQHVTLTDVAARTLPPFDGEPARIRLRVPPVDINPAQAVGLALCLHELATNAVKHGALSAPSGWVDVEGFAVTGDGVTELRWSEHGGPPVAPPERQGFGTRMLRGAIAPGLSSPELRFDVSGVTWRLRIARM